MGQHLRNALNTLRSKAAELRESFGDDARARALEWAACQIEEAIRDSEDSVLTLAEASLRSGYSPDHLARLIREEKIPNAGRRGAPRVRAGDLPKRRPPGIANGENIPYHTRTDARSLGIRRGGFANGD